METGFTLSAAFEGKCRVAPAVTASVDYGGPPVDRLITVVPLGGGKAIRKAIAPIKTKAGPRTVRG